MSALVRVVSLPTVLVALAGCAEQPTSDAASRSGPLQGVWSVVSVDASDASVIDPSQPGLYIFAASHYSAVYTPGPNPRVKSVTSFLPTPDEMVAQYQTIIVNSGSYEVDGSSFTLRPMIAKSPGFVGGYLTGTYSLSGDTLVLRHEHLFDLEGAELPDFEEILTLVRIE
jgi:hypothetical protein